MTDNVPPLPLPVPMRRLPWSTADGRPCYVPQGVGIINELADAVEAEIITTAVNDGAGALLGAEDPHATKENLRQAARRLAYALDDVVRVAELRAERTASGSTTTDRARRLSEALRASIVRRTT
ncbi:hypothetical protein ABZT45_03775 [Streptomyces sp. NPDC005356]|uniref:hypothetical protein n=1 Tax=Streptomyces sp. NPDC005356 TaxID=3157167 RepID=UPI0033B2A834